MRLGEAADQCLPCLWVQPPFHITLDYALSSLCIEANICRLFSGFGDLVILDTPS